MKKKITDANKKYLPNEYPRKILSLDGGGIRGVLTLEILQEMENQLRVTLKKGPDFCLGDYFDFIGGTSTGAIIAAGLSKGMKVEKLLNFYQERGRDMFKRSIFKIHRSLYKRSPIIHELKQVFGEGCIDIEKEDFKTLLLTVVLNYTTDSPWPICNIPWMKYNAPNRPDCNLNIPLYKLVRASTAAPIYFPAETLHWDPKNLKKTFEFIDGGITPYNNPSFLMYRLATHKAYRLDWKTGEKNLLIVSVGTGAAYSGITWKLLPHQLINATSRMMYAMQVDQDINCRMVGRCIFGESIDRELGDMIPTSKTNRKFSYIRYNADISQEGLNEMGFPKFKSKNIRKMNKPKNMEKLREIGKVAGKKQVKVVDHFKNFLS